MRALAQPLPGQTEPIWCVQWQPPSARSGTCLPRGIAARRCRQLRAGGAVRPELLLLHAELRLVLCRVPPSRIFAQSWLVIYSSGTEQAEGEGAEFYFSCRGKWWAKGIEGESENECPVLLGSL